MMKISAKQYAQILFESTDEKTEQEISVAVGKFVEVLKKDGQLKDYKKIIENFSKIYDSEHEIVEAEFVTKNKIEGSNLKAVKDYIEKKYNAKEIIIKNTVDNNVKGGAIIKVGDEILDSSVAMQLKKLKKLLIS